MRKLGVGIKSKQIFVLVIMIFGIMFLLFSFPFAISGLVSLVFLIFSLNYMTLYTITLEGNFFVIENLFFRKIIDKKDYIGFNKISSLFNIYSLKFNKNRSFKFMQDNSFFDNFFKPQLDSDLAKLINEFINTERDD